MSEIEKLLPDYRHTSSTVTKISLKSIEKN